MNSPFRSLFKRLGPILAEAGVGEAEWRQGIEQIELELASLGIEAAQAEADCLALSQAVRDASRFPHLHRLHAGITDFLTLELPAEVAVIAKRLLEVPPDDIEPFGEMLAHVVRGGASRAERGLARLMMFESARLAIAITTWRDRGELIAAITERELDDLAETEVSKVLENCTADDLIGPDAIRPTTVTLATAMCELTRLFGTAQKALAQSTTEFVDLYRRRAVLEETLGQMNSPDALLIRNYVAEEFGEQRLSVERLVQHHPVAFGDGPLDRKKRNRLDQRLHRMLERGDVNALRRKSPAIIDLLTAQMRETEV